MQPNDSIVIELLLDWPFVGKHFLRAFSHLAELAHLFR